MAESVKVWVKTTVLDEIVHGKSLHTTKRSIPDASNPNADKGNQNWGWARATVVTDDEPIRASGKKDEGFLGGGNNPVKLFIQDEESDHNRNTIEISGEAIKEGGVVMANIYQGDSDDEDDDYDFDGHRAPGECKYPDDLITLTHLHEPAVIYALRKRYAMDKIYTDTGPILLALNPFKNCGTLYSDNTMSKYRKRGERSMDLLGGGGGEEKKSESGDNSMEDEYLPPHVFAIADKSFRVMMSRLESSGRGGGARRGKTDATVCIDQSILVSGESGAGKTVTTKFIMKYLAQLSQTSTSSRNLLAADKGGNSKGGMEKQVLQSNPILESFGNARTIRNDNSSRFGKYIEIQFTRQGALTGASIKTYLLEKVRLVHQMPGERNYHVFYELLQGFTDDEFDKYFIGDLMAEDFKMISMSGTFDRRDGVEDFDTYKDLRDAMDVMKFPEEEQSCIMASTCACLHGLNLDFISLSADECKINEENPHLEAVLSLLGVTYEQLNQAVCYFSIQAGKERHTRSLPKDKAEKGMQGLVKAYYGALFTYLVHRINASITVKEEGGGGRRSRGDSGRAASIGVLDIFGFESFKVNSFEQLCINYCNETLQQQFNLFVLKNEQEEYDREGIKWSFISFPENQEVLDLIGKGNGKGILSILDGQCRAPGTTDKTFANAIYKTLTPHNRFQANFRQVGALKFGVVHYAGPVEYDTIGFVEKNKDELPREATELLSSSKEELSKILGGILSDPSAPVGAVGSPAKGSPASPTSPTPRARGASSRLSTRSHAASRMTVGGQFSTQLQELRAKIDLTSPHYVRCLKPNDLLVPDHFDPVIIADQLRSAGVVEAVRVSRLGYPQRYSHAMFLNRYKVLALKELKRAAKLSKREKPVDVLVSVIAQRIHALENDSDESKEEDKGSIDLETVGIQVGKTKVFLRRKAFDILEGFRSQKMVEGGITIQAAARRYIAFRDYKILRKAVIKIQSQTRSMICAKVVDELRRDHAATVIQTKWRRTALHHRYVNIKFFAACLQKLHRGRVGRAKYLKLNRIRKSIVIQKYWRSYYLTKTYKKKKESALTLQCAVRSYFAREVLKDLKAKAKNLAAMSGERDQLRKENSDMKNKLEAMQLRVDAAMKKVAEVEGSAQAMKDLEASNKNLQLEREKLQASLEEVNKKANEESERANNAEKIVESKTEEYDNLQKEADQLKATVESLEKSVEETAAGTNQEAERLQNEIETLRVEVKELQKNNEAQLEEAKSKEATLTEDIENLNAELEKLQNEVEESKLSKEVAAERALEAANDASAEIEAAVASAEAALNETHSAEVDELQEQIKNLELELEGSNKTIEEQSQQIPTGEVVNSEELEQATKEIAELKKELEEARAESSAREAQISEAELAKQVELEVKKAKEEMLVKLDAAEQGKEDLLKHLAAAEEEKKELLAELEKGARKTVRRELPPVEATGDVRHQLALAYEEKEMALEDVAIAEKERDEALAKLVSSEKATEKALRKLAAAEKAKSEAQQLVYSAKSSEEFDDQFNEQDEALLAVNSMLRKELEGLTAELSKTKQLLQDERESAKKDLEAFSSALRGVDELRQSAEVMSRELQRVKQKKRRQKILQQEDDYDDFDDDATIATVATTTLDNAAKVLNRHQQQQQENPIWKRFTNVLSRVREDY